MTLSMRFCGAARTVTGSCYWLQTPTARFLVDCGMFQGPKTLRALNYEKFPFTPSGIDFVLQTHAHIDHSGLLPKLYRDGFRGPVHMTRGTRDLLAFMLPDSGFIQEMEVEQLNRRNQRRGRPVVTPIYTQRDAYACQERFETIEYEVWREVAPGVRVRYWNAGHILGSASIELELETGREDPPKLRMLFSGDIGPDQKLFHPDPEASSDFDFVVCESTYGGRPRARHSAAERRSILAREVREALLAGGNLLIPSFAVERTQELLADLSLAQDAGDIGPAPVFLDSPMAIKATETFERHASELEGLREQPHLIDNPNIHFTETVDESKAINRIHSGAIIMAASGMCDAGRIRHHLRNHLWRADCTVLIVGYQAPGTLGRLLVDGAKQVTIQGDVIQVRARIREIDVYSGHADHGELIDWIEERAPIHRALYLTHGDAESSEALREALVARGSARDTVIVPGIDDEVDLLGAGRRPHAVARRIAPEAGSRLDWHNDAAQLLIDIREALDKAADEKARGVVIRRLRRALEDENHKH
ncbi:MBL fold metallo-hydrolase [Breoghania sp. L-A4]|uniref:MBL fold metallo-hydrolase RNA specificity domain-containing protein n=1 Tax=Breoghania sp. L-A4 TaxID=2304600 RepID=UPI000E35916D|nr:MBL fold metallo-hydrolase [Breoghania sp. L-A4]AXS39331.1 MBL fold metallo-hydrolase [Breoghania sp. L-A4]